MKEKTIQSNAEITVELLYLESLNPLGGQTVRPALKLTVNRDGKTIFKDMKLLPPQENITESQFKAYSDKLTRSISKYLTRKTS